jgi:hypothetical protein
MEYGLLGKSGCAVSAFALGTLTFGNETDESVSFVQLDRFTAAGGTMMDTAAAPTADRWLARTPDIRETVVLVRSRSRLPGRVLCLRVLIPYTGPATERMRVCEVDDDEGRRLVRIVRREAGRW